MKAVVYHGVGDLRLEQPLVSAIEALKIFDQRTAVWIKVELKPAVAT